MFRLVTLACCGIMALADAGADVNRRVPMERGVEAHNSTTSSWSKLERPPSDQLMTFTVALRISENRRAELERVFWEVSDPDHQNYGKHRSSEEITEILAVPVERVERVRTQLLSWGAVEANASVNRDMIRVVMPVVAVEAALETQIHRFGHNHHDVQILRASRGYSLPSSVAADVLMVGELLQFPNLHSKRLESLVGGAGDWPNACEDSSCKGLVTPSVIAQRYKLPTNSGDKLASTSNSMAVSEFQGQYYEPSDLQKFSASCHRDVTVAKNIGDNVPGAGVESELDIEYIKGVAPEIPLTVIYDAQFSLLSWAGSLNDMSDPPLVVSVSYGNDEAQQSSTEYMYTCNTAFMKAGSRGVSILFASGDQGVCGREGCGFINKRFKPDFPAASPYITAVGGTDFLGNGIGDEMAWSAGGGGFSDTFAIPDYQKEAVAAYKSNPDAQLPAAKLWNNTGRGYPDVAAFGGQKTPYCVATGGNFEGVAGTSASCPVVAGVFAKLNGLRLAAGKAPLGFLNPFIYKNPGGFQDVTHGSNPGSSSTGFNAIKGWDPATGFGTPDYEALSKLAMAAGSPQMKAIVV